VCETQTVAVAGVGEVGVEREIEAGAVVAFGWEGGVVERGEGGEGDCGDRVGLLGSCVSGCYLGE
jgi:hypothetical protein